MCDQDIEISLVGALMEEEPTDHEMHTIYTFYNMLEKDSKIKTIFNNVLTSFFTGVFDKNGIKLHVDYQKTLFELNDEKFNVLQNMFRSWCEEVDNDILITIFEEYIKQLNQLDKEKNKIFVQKMYNELTMTNVFKANLENYSKFDIGMLYETRGIFSPLFNRKETKFASNHLNNFNNVDVYELIDQIKPILENPTLYSSTIDYIHEILCVNEDFTRDDSRYIDVTKASTVSFNKFLLIILLEILSKIGFDNINNIISQCEITHVKEYDIQNLQLEQKLVVTIAKAIPICHIGAIKLYHSCKSSLASYKGFSSLIMVQPNKTKQIEILEEKMAMLMSIFSYDRSNNLLQNFYVNYYKSIYPKLDIDEIYTDIISFTDLITSFPPTKNIYGVVSPKLFQVCSEILGNSNMTKHTRHYSAELLFKLIPTNGFNIAPTFFNDLFRYIGDIDYYKWMNLLSAIKHHKKILQNMIMLLDYPEKVFEQSDKIVSKTLYTLLGNAVESYTQFESICEKSKDEPMYYQLEELFGDFFDIVMMTLNVYTNIYTKAIVKKSYAEAEEKYSILVHKLIDSCTSEKSVINTIFKREQLVNQLLSITYQSLYDHIEISAKYLAQHKKIIIDGFNKSDLSAEKCEVIKELLEKFFKHDINYPEEFLDPLLCTPIVEPIMLPGIKEIHDRVAIVSQIHESGKNPYNREPLSLDQLEEYNETPEIKKQLEDFLKRKKEFEHSISS